MSNVHRSDQKPAKPQFLITARELQSYTLDRCMHQFSKRYTFYIGIPLAGYAREVYANVKRGNSVSYPRNQHEVQIRRDCFIMAQAELQNLTSQVELAYESVRFDAHYMDRWSELINKEISLINGVMEADAKRYKNLPGP